MPADALAAVREALDLVRRLETILSAVLEGDESRDESVGASRGELRVKEVADQFGVSPQTARRWAERFGRKIGGVWFVDPARLVSRGVAADRRRRRPT